MRAVLIAGGSGGHLIPAMTLAESLRAKGWRPLIAVGRRQVERVIRQGCGEGEWFEVDAERLTPLWRWFDPRFAGRQSRAFVSLRLLLREIKPRVVVGFGGYLSAFGVLAARLEGIPCLLHEQNLRPGRANRWLSRWAKAVAVSFPQTRTLWRGRVRVEVTGNPVRPSVHSADGPRARAEFGFSQDRPVLLVTGGSQGSCAVNDLALGMWAHASSRDRARVQVIHLAGSEAARVRRGYRKCRVEARVFSFLKEMERALAAADLALSRAGATAVSEMTARGLPAVLIPYPYAGGHQRANAEWMAAAGGAVVLEEGGLDPARLWREVSALLENPARLGKMRAGLRAHSDGSVPVDRLAQLVREVAA